MRHVSFNPDDLPSNLKGEWDALQQRASDATNAIIKAWEANQKITGDNFDNTVWRDIKQFLMEHVFHKKCAYCETNLAEARQDADAEHFRPKLGVNYKNILEPGNRTYVKAKVLDLTKAPPKEIEHPGYFWLAYNWKNLLPACRYCNSKNGKKNQFPVKDEVYVFLVKMSDAETEDLADPYYTSAKWPDVRYLGFEDIDKREHRYLLHPYWDANPSEYIGFDEFGHVYAKEINGSTSLIGKHSISTYDLSNADLDTARQKEQERVKNVFKYSIAFYNSVRGLSLAEAKQKTWEEAKIKEVKAGQTAYSQAALDYLRLMEGS